MKLFPKKYKIQDLHTRARNYRITHQNNTDNEKKCVFTISSLSISEKLSYRDLLLIYIKDFFNRKENIATKQEYEHLFLASSNLLENLCACYKLFNKKKQTLPQV
jgi:hypothetical protein